MSILPYIETFAAVVEKGSFTAAAEALGISKPVVSKQVSQLEQHLGVQLLHRTTRRLHLTEAGEIFARYSQQIVAEAQEAEQSVLPLQSEPQGTLRITAPESLAASMLPDALLGFQQRFPKVELDVRISGRFVDLVEEGIDVALRVGELEDSSMIARRLLYCHFQVYGSPEYWKRHGIPSHPDELRTYNCLIYTQSPKPDTWNFKDRNGEDISVKITGNLRSDAGRLLLDAVVDGQGIMIAPSYMVAKALKEEQLEAVLEDYSLSPIGLYAIYPQSKHISTKVRAFVDYLVDTWNS
ncbi:MAG: LysR family transcriptional regulator [endosymbiont of Escarpia spicata]|uniref:LysR family transcriptional regulator n=1 Tax=endosymbiont of Escarpia spicata TaxID=2200908 RepID=A0A370DRD6_9GAMM|nr:MAG: LysR family transcriptional regulator [endosymbiont of Escarpia spicata]